jgi:hypothetical protein
MSFVEHYNIPSQHLHPRAFFPAHSFALRAHMLASLATYQMRPPHLIHRLCIIQLDVQVLVHALERSADLHFVFEFDGDFVLDERFEETVVSLLVYVL